MRVSQHCLMVLVEGMKYAGVNEVEILTMNFGEEGFYVILKNEYIKRIEGEPPLFIVAENMTRDESVVLSEDLLNIFKKEIGHYCKLSLTNHDNTSFRDMLDNLKIKTA
jgi:hypothetical protein